MDALPITPGELLCLGSSLAFSGLFYYLHRRKAKVAAKIQEAPKLQVGDDLRAVLSATGTSCLQYVAIEGIVQPDEAALTSPYHKELQGVIERLVLKEHRLVWNSLARSWVDSERVVLEQVHSVPFVLTSPCGKAGAKVSVESPLRAVELPLETVYERFQQTAHGFKDLLSHYLSGEKPKGFLETEEMLLVGSSLTGIGELALHPDGSLHLQPPADGAGYFLRLSDWQSLLAELESTSSFWKWATLLCGLAAAAALLRALCRAYRSHRLKQEKEQERRAFEDLRLHKGGLAAEPDEELPASVCVICLSNPRQCVLLPCGHACCCFRCFQALPRRTCPICRSPIDRVVPLYLV